MKIEIHLDDAETQIINQIVYLSNEPGLTAEKCAHQLLSDVLTRVWADLTADDILN